MRLRNFIDGQRDAASRSAELPEVPTFAQLGGTVVASSPEEFRKVIVDDIAKWKRVAAQSDIKLD